jgi:hypothetical protein
MNCLLAHKVYSSLTYFLLQADCFSFASLSEANEKKKKFSLRPLRLCGE